MCTEDNSNSGLCGVQNAICRKRGKRLQEVRRVKDLLDVGAGDVGSVKPQLVPNLGY